MSTSGLRASLPLVVAGFIISFVLVGGGIDTVSVFLNAVAQSTHWSRSSLSLGVSVGAVSAALSTPLVGTAVDRIGIRVPMAAGVLLLATGFAVLIFMTEAWHFAAANVFLGAGFGACALLPITVAVTIHVPDRTALALGIISAGASAGALVLAPAAQALIEAVGWRSAYIVMGSFVVFTPVPLLLFALPRGRLRRRTATTQRRPAATHGLLHDLLRPGVASLAAIMILPALAGFSVSVHLVPYLTGLGYAGTAAAATLGATIGVSAIGKVGGGFVADRYGALATLRLALGLWVMALALLHHAASPAALGGFIALYGLAFGTQIAVVPPIAVTLLNAERFGALFGILQLASMLASALGPIASGLIYDRTGTYGGAIALWLGVVAVAVVVAASMRAADGVAEVASEA
ncbi:MAG: MFS transporter [Deltaproteobacteria bacterium]|nr:MFS transporter [Deltaproteobacteria bacterium]